MILNKQDLLKENIISTRFLSLIKFQLLLRSTLEINFDLNQIKFETI